MWVCVGLCVWVCRWGGGDMWVGRVGGLGCWAGALWLVGGIGVGKLCSTLGTAACPSTGIQFIILNSTLPALRLSLTQRDVPGFTRAAIPLLYGQGVRALSVGVNGGSAPPGVPKNTPFWWRDGPSGAALLAFWHPGEGA